MRKYEFAKNHLIKTMEGSRAEGAYLWRYLNKVINNNDGAQWEWMVERGTR